ncbi:MAG TPA: MBG domain-containing protein, partial [Gammaproteobacteria bacterium]|nr:MBG domain-containing protein [Gammaproteobacteria bacterium]
VTFNALSGSAAGNYSLANALSNAPTLSVTAAPLSASIANQTKVYGANDPLLSGIGVTLGGIINRTVSTWNGNVSVNDTGNVATSLASLTRAAGETVASSPYNITAVTFNALSGSAVGNYTLSNSLTGSPTLSVTAASLSGSIANQTKVYGANDPLLSGIGVTLSGIINRTVSTWTGNVPVNDTGNVTASINSLARAAGETVASSPYNITAVTFNALSGSAAGNYSLPNALSSTPTLSITAASLSGSIANQTKAYGTNDPLISGIHVILNGVINNPNINTWNGNVSINDTNNVSSSLTSLIRNPGENVGNYTITAENFASLSGPAANNYSFPTSSSGALLTITPVTLTASIPDQTKVYGTNDPSASSISATLSGVLQGITVTDWNNQQTVINDNVTSTLANYARVSGENVGAYLINAATFNPLTGTGAGNYNAPTTFTGAPVINITKAPLTISAIAQSKVYGTNDPVFPFNSSGFINAIVDGTPINDNPENSLTGALSRQLISQADENIGPHAITQGTLSANNYDIAYTGNILTITKAPLTAYANAATKTYGTLDPNFTYRSVGLVNGIVDGIPIHDVITGSLTRVVDPSTQNVGSYPILQGTLQASNNYTFNYVGNNLSISRAFLNISGVAANSKIYNGSTAATLNMSSAVLSGILQTDIGNVLITNGFGMFASANPGANIPVAATSIPLSGEASGNYSLILPVGLSADIIPDAAPSSPGVILQPIIQVIIPTQITQPIQVMPNNQNSSTSTSSQVVTETINIKTPTGFKSEQKSCSVVAKNIEICT